MLIKKVWLQASADQRREWQREGWYLFGLILIYARDCGPRERRG